MAQYGKWTKKQRERAKAEGWGLITIAIDGRFLAEKPFGFMEFCGPSEPEATAEVVAFFNRFLEDRHKETR